VPVVFSIVHSRRSAHARAEPKPAAPLVGNLTGESYV
jgi:hypothetical protein